LLGKLRTSQKANWTSTHLVSVVASAKQRSHLICVGILYLSKLNFTQNLVRMYIFNKCFEFE